MPYIQVDIATELSPTQLARMREEIVDVVHAAIGSARAHINVAIRQLAKEQLVEAGETASEQMAAQA